MRTDCHRPSVIIPEDYQYVACEHTKDECWEYAAAQREIIQAHMKRTGGTYSRHAHGGNCHICGAHAIYTALFWHIPTNTYVRAGSECAEKLDCQEVEAFRKLYQDALQALAGKRKAEAILAQAGLQAVWEIKTDGYEESIIRDVTNKLVAYGSLSDKQMKLLSSLLERIQNRPAIEAQRKAEHDAAQPVPTGRFRIAGKILSIKVQETDFGPVTKMLMQHEDGWKVYGTCPAHLDNAHVGDVVEFKATVKVSNKDPKFGFYSRPTK